MARFYLCQHLSEKLDSWLDAFRKEVVRRVTRDCTISFNGRLFEAPTRFFGEQLSLLYHQHRPNRVEVIFKGCSHGWLVPLDLAVNAEVKQDKPIQGKLPFMSQEEGHEL